MTVYYPGPVPPDVPSRKASVTADWMRTIKQAVHDLQFAAYMLYGGTDGVLGVGDPVTDSMKAVATAPASMRVSVNPGAVCALETVVRKSTSTLTAALTAPTTNPVVYLIQYNLELRAVSIKVGVEAETPDAPAPSANCIALATVYVRVGATSVKNTDDGVNGYIEDARVFVNV